MKFSSCQTISGSSSALAFPVRETEGPERIGADAAAEKEGNDGDAEFGEGEPGTDEVGDWADCAARETMPHRVQPFLLGKAMKQAELESVVVSVKKERLMDEGKTGKLNT